MPDDPAVDADARLLCVNTPALTVATVYAVNGKTVDDPAYLTSSWRGSTRCGCGCWRRWTCASPCCLAGDFNITPDDRDVHDPTRGAARTSPASPNATGWLALEAVGLVDLGTRSSR